MFFRYVRRHFQGPSRDHTRADDSDGLLYNPEHCEIDRIVSECYFAFPVVDAGVLFHLSTSTSTGFCAHFVVLFRPLFLLPADDDECSSDCELNGDSDNGAKLVEVKVNSASKRKGKGRSKPKTVLARKRRFLLVKWKGVGYG